jgi:ABC-type lipoprotein release transport system permease subunit
VPFRKLIRVVIQNISRSKKNFVFSSIGIIVGITTFTFFFSLSHGIRERVLNRMFPIDQVEVEPTGGGAVDSDEDSGGAGASGPRVAPRRLDKQAIEQLGQIEGVTKTFPKMRARFPMRVEAGIFDRRIGAEGFVEGLEPSRSVVDEMKKNEEACSEQDECRRRNFACTSDEECAYAGMECRDNNRCGPRQYWKSFYDHEVAKVCSNHTDCADAQDGRGVCTYDRWVVIKANMEADAKTLQRTLNSVPHKTPATDKHLIDIDIFPVISEQGSIDDDDVRNARNVGAELWTIGWSSSLNKGVSTTAMKAIKKYGLTLRTFANADDAIAHIESIPKTITSGVCGGRKCELEKAEKYVRGKHHFTPVYKNHSTGECPSRLYCATRSTQTKKGRCSPYMPVIIAPMMIDFYNATVVSQLKTRPIPTPCFVLGLKGYFWLGYSFLSKSVPKPWQRIRWAEVVGFSDKAMQLGGTVPLGYMERFNRFYLGPNSTKYYDSVLLQVPRNENVAEVIEEIKKKNFDLSSRSKLAQKAGDMLKIITWTFILISIIIIIISAMNISHTFLMVIFERQHEIGIMRAIGASQMAIRKIVLAESALIGLVGGVVGNVLSYGVSRFVNLLVASLSKRIPLIPDNLFIYDWKLIVGSIGFALVFCIVGAWVPANRAAKMDPAAVLTSA